MRISFPDLFPWTSGASFADELASRFKSTRDGVNASLQHRGDYDATLNYDTNDAATSGGLDYRALAPSLGVTPGTDATKWKLLGAAPDATAATKGVVKLTTAPVLGTNPLAVGDNDPRLAPQSTTFAEGVQDVMGAALVDSATIDATYNDAGNLETLDVKPGTVAPAPHTHTSADVSDFQQAARDALEYATGAPVQTVADLRAVTATHRQDKQQRLVEDVGVTYRFDSQGTGTDDGAGIIAPDDGAAGRWFKSSAAASSTGNADTLGGQNGDYYRNRANHTGTQPAASVTGLASVATSGAYADLTGKPGTFGGSGTSHAAGLVPDPGATVGATRFLREDGAFQAPPVNTGPQGAQGIKGDKGDTGAQGLQGPQGPAGSGTGTGGTAQGFNFRGAWAANTAYNSYDVVTYGGSTYESSTAFTSGATFNAANWNLWAAKGTDGAAGAAGPQGQTGATGAQGAAGANGTNGTNGAGVPTGGAAGQILAKNSATNYDTAWVNAPPGGTAGSASGAFDYNSTWLYGGF